MNPHAEDIKSLIKSIANPQLSYLDLGAGDGLVSRELIESNCNKVEGCDPYLFNLYRDNIGRECLKYSFEDIAMGKLTKKYDIVICSYSLHLAQLSYLPNILYCLARISDRLIILTPHKRPVIKDYWRLAYESKLGKSKMKIYDKI